MRAAPFPHATITIRHLLTESHCYSDAAKWPKVVRPFIVRPGMRVSPRFACCQALLRIFGSFCSECMELGYAVALKERFAAFRTRVNECLQRQRYGRRARVDPAGFGPSFCKHGGFGYLDVDALAFWPEVAHSFLIMSARSEESHSALASDTDAGSLTRVGHPTPPWALVRTKKIRIDESGLL